MPIVPMVVVVEGDVAVLEPSLEAKQFPWKQNSSPGRKTVPLEAKQFPWKQNSSPGSKTVPLEAKQSLGSKTVPLEAKQFP